MVSYLAKVKTEADATHPNSRTAVEHSCIRGRFRWNQVEDDYRDDAKKEQKVIASHALFTQTRRKLYPELVLQKKTQLPSAPSSARWRWIGT